MQPPTHYTIRKFLEEEVALYKAIRLMALKEEPGMFGNSYELEADFPNEQWSNRITNPNGACFGLFYKMSRLALPVSLLPARKRKGRPTSRNLIFNVLTGEKDCRTGFMMQDYYGQNKDN